MKCYLIIAMILIFTGVKSQYANAGASVNRSNIAWFNWNATGANVSAGIGNQFVNGNSATFITRNGTNVTAVISNINTNSANNWVAASSSNNFDELGVVFPTMFVFNPAINNAITSYGNAGNWHSFRVTITATRGGVNVPVRAVITDAEASTNAEVNNYITTGTNWSTIENFNPNAAPVMNLQNCGTANCSLSNTYNGNNLGQLPILVTNSTTATPVLTLTCTQSHGNQGGMATSIGVFDAEDFGDLPTGGASNYQYGQANHEIQYNIQNPCTNLVNLQLVNSLFLGNQSGDADIPSTNTMTPINDNVTGIDEEAIASFPSYAGNGSYSVTLPVRNITGQNAFLYGWFDFNRDGIFQAIERVTTTTPIANNANSQNITLTWTGIPAIFAASTLNPASNNFAFRFRISTVQAEAQSSTGYASDGEVEDYFVPLCSLTVPAITGTPTVCINSTTQLSNTTIGGAWSSNNTAVATVSGTGLVTGVAAGTATITYSVTQSGCTSSVPQALTVKALPTVAAITGTPIVCISSTTQLSNTTAGGTWSSNNTAVATVSSTGLVTGVAAGTSTITYSVTQSGCTTNVTKPIIVNGTTLSAINADKTFCINSGILASCSPAGGSWSVVSGCSNCISLSPYTPNPAVANTEFTIVNSTQAGSVVIKYELSGVACPVFKTINVLGFQAPTVGFIQDPNPACMGANATITLTDIPANTIVDTWYDDGGNEVGNAGQTAFTSSTYSGCYHIDLNDNTTGCDNEQVVCITRIECPPPSDCNDKCYWTVTGNNIYPSSSKGIMNNIFGTLNEAQVRVMTSSTDRGVITLDGRLGWNTQFNNDARKTISTLFHVNCKPTEPWMEELYAQGKSAIRFENLQTKSGGYVLVTDDEGYVYNSQITLGKFRMQESKQIELETKNQDLQAQIDELKLQVKALLEARNYSTPCKVETPKANTLEVVPTPFANNAKAIYNLENFSGEATLQIVDITGKVLKSIAITQAKGQVEIGNLQTTISTVIFNIVSNGKLLVSKKSIKTTE